MNAHAVVAACFALCCAAISLSLGVAEIILLRTMDQGLPAAGLMAAGVAGYVAGQTYARRIGQGPAGLALLGHLGVMAAVLFVLAIWQPMLFTGLFGESAPVPLLQTLPAQLTYGLTLAALCLALATFRSGARHALERDIQAGTRPT